MSICNKIVLYILVTKGQDRQKYYFQLLLMNNYQWKFQNINKMPTLNIVNIYNHTKTGIT